MKLDIYQIDAFAKGPFTGNPAAVIPLESWLPDELMQKIAQENNLSETAFFVPIESGYHIRWFTPAIEVRLCGHATLATAFVVFNHLNFEGDKIEFHSKSGPLAVFKSEEGLTLDFPTDTLVECDQDPIFKASLGVQPIKCFRGADDYVLVMDSQSTIEQLKPDFSKLKRLDSRGVIVTAKGDEEYDFVSRGFFPKAGIDEDPATGSAHTSLSPYWSKVLGKDKMKSCQLSHRKGYFVCHHKGDRTEITGKCYDYLKGSISI